MTSQETAVKTLRSRIVNAFACTAIACIALFVMSAPSRADTGQIRMVITKAAFIVGAGGGQGMLVLHGHQYPLSIGGLSLGLAIGASTTKLSGTVSKHHPPYGHRRYL